MDVDVELVAAEVARLLREATPSTVVMVQEDGGISIQRPGLSDFAGTDRRRRPVATFIASQRPMLAGEIAARIRVGLRKRGFDPYSEAIPG